MALLEEEQPRTLWNLAAHLALQTRQIAACGVCFRSDRVRSIKMSDLDELR